MAVVIVILAVPFAVPRLGTVQVSDVDEDTDMLPAVVVPNVTVVFPAPVTNPVPVMVTVSPDLPEDGEMDVYVGAGGAPAKKALRAANIRACTPARLNRTSSFRH